MHATGVTASCVLLFACVCLNSQSCRVLEADALAPLVRLRELRLEDNLIRSLSITPPAAAVAPGSPMSQSAAGGDNSGLAGLLPSLCVLQLSGNRLMDLAELDRLALLPSLLEVTLAGNPLARKQVGVVMYGTASNAQRCIQWCSVQERSCICSVAKWPDHGM
jgi:Leucine-rich repeat (LRR) protein